MATRVEKGAALLDVKRPGWYKPEHFDLSDFDLSSPRRCVLGKVYGNYWEGLRMVYGGDDAEKFSFDHAFDTERTRDYAALQAEWVREILKRREADERSEPTFDGFAGTPVATFEGTIKVGGKEIKVPEVSIDYLLKLVEANK